MFRVKITIRDGEIEIGAQSSEEGDSQETVAAEYNGDEIQIGFNSQYIQEFLNVAAGKPIVESESEDSKAEKTTGAARVSFSFKDSNAQTQLSLVGISDDYKYVVMPLRI